MVPLAPFSNSTVAWKASSTSTVPPGRSRDERLQQARQPGRLADEIARLIDHVRAEVAERSRAGLLLVEPPDLRELRVHHPLLVIAAAEVVDLTELAGLDDLLGQDDRRIEAVVERRHVLHAGGGDLPPDLVGLVGVAAERLLADDVLARLGGGDGRLEMGVVRPAVVEDLHVGIRDDVFPAASSTSRSRSGAPPRGPPSSVRPAIATSRGMYGGGQVAVGDLLERVRVRACP